MSTLNLDPDTERQLQDLSHVTGKTPLEVVQEALRTYRQTRAESDPLQEALRNAPDDDEAVSAEEERLMEEAEQDLTAGRVSSLAEIKQRLLGHS
ncbi:MAG: hypothetical protein V2J55_22260 [Candidatus Competibacteraceae bacterium]|jgi:predicted transcriptional regulator|nr:hypothetical protein [Candidatus Competibacteraceae bacterium]